MLNASSDDFGMRERHEYWYFAGAGIVAFFGVLLLVGFSGSHADCRTPLPADVPTGLRDCTRIGIFYFAAWVLIVVAVVVAAAGVRALLRRGNEPASSPRG
jgi:uncharacterized membrane protein YhaH (DUF805 family)